MFVRCLELLRGTAPELAWFRWEKAIENWPDLRMKYIACVPNPKMVHNTVELSETNPSVRSTSYWVVSES